MAGVTETPCVSSDVRNGKRRERREERERMCKKVIYSVFIPSLLLVAETAVESSAQHVTLPDGQ